MVVEVAVESALVREAAGVGDLTDIVFALAQRPAGGEDARFDKEFLWTDVERGVELALELAEGEPSEFGELGNFNRLGIVLPDVIDRV